MSLSGKCECYLGFTGQIVHNLAMIIMFLVGSSCEFGKNKCLNNCSGHGYCNTYSQCECQAGESMPSCFDLELIGYLDIDCSFQARCPDLCCHNGKCRQDGRCECRNEFFGTSCAVSGQQVLLLTCV